MDVERHASDAPDGDRAGRGLVVGPRIELERKVPGAGIDIRGAREPEELAPGPLGRRGGVRSPDIEPLPLDEQQPLRARARHLPHLVLDRVAQQPDPVHQHPLGVATHQGLHRRADATGPSSPRSPARPAPATTAPPRSAPARRSPAPGRRAPPRRTPTRSPARRAGPPPPPAPARPRPASTSDPARPSTCASADATSRRPCAGRRPRRARPPPARGAPSGRGTSGSRASSRPRRGRARAG